jgi:hypothetical protein
MLVMRTIEDPTNPLGKLIGSQQPVGLDHFSLAVYPLRLDGVEPRTLLGQQAADDPHSLCALFDFSVVRSKPASDLPADLWVKASPRRQPLRPSPKSQGSSVVSELPPRAVEHLPKSLGALFLVEGLAGSFGARGSGPESILRPLWLNSWMASRTVCWPQPRLWAILGACSPLELASKIWDRRKVKASLERREALEGLTLLI